MNSKVSPINLQLTGKICFLLKLYEVLELIRNDGAFGFKSKFIYHLFACCCILFLLLKSIKCLGTLTYIINKKFCQLFG